MRDGDRERARIGVIGTGWWATYAHLPSLRNYPAADLVAIADPNEAALHRAGDAFGVGQRYDDYRRMLDEETLDGVVVATPHVTHFAIVRDALERGLGVMVEKPMVLRAVEARQLVALAGQRGGPLIVGYPYHFVEQYGRLRDAIAAGRLGQIQLVQVLFASMVLEYYRGNPAAYQAAFAWDVTGPGAATYSDPSVAGGGQGQTQVTHAAALLFWLTGLRPVEVAAAMENFGLQVDLCDALCVRFEGGAIGTLASTGGIPTAQAGNQQLEYRIYGSTGYALLDAMAGTCAIYTDDGAVDRFEAVLPDAGYPKEATARHLVDVLLGRADNRSPGELGMRVVELLDAAYRSAAERRFVRIDEL
jgi:predicted dehydrogenase